MVKDAIFTKYVLLTKKQKTKTILCAYTESRSKAAPLKSCILHMTCMCAAVTEAIVMSCVLFVWLC